MANDPTTIPVYLENGTKKTFAGALDWPGWCRSGRDEAAALKALLDYAPRYARALKSAGMDFQPPADAAGLEVIERLSGTPTTDFGAPDVATTADRLPLDDAELRRLEEILKAGWRALDAAAQMATGKELAKGPRGGGRDVEGILRHVMGAEEGYLARIGGKAPKTDSSDLAGELAQSRKAILKCLEDAVGVYNAQGEIPAGPRGGKRWSPRYFVRRTAWHAFDHAWEIEDRVEG